MTVRFLRIGVEDPSDQRLSNWLFSFAPEGLVEKYPEGTGGRVTLPYSGEFPHAVASHMAAIMNAAGIATTGFHVQEVP